MKSIQKLALRKETLRMLTSMELPQVLGANSGVDPCLVAVDSKRVQCPVRAEAELIEID
jgi:hypothetical protein